MLQLLCSLGKVVIRVTCYCWQIANNIQYMNVHYYCVQNYLNVTYICWSFVWTGKRQFLIWKFTQNLLLNTLGPLINYADKSQFFTYISIHADYYINKNLTYALKKIKSSSLLVGLRHRYLIITCFLFLLMNFKMNHCRNLEKNINEKNLITKGGLISESFSL